jgi:hypothetical protein
VLSKTQVSDCAACPVKKACSSATSVPIDCIAGHFCPLGTGNQHDYACPAGTYYAGTDADEVGDCTACPQGSWCEGGQGAISGACSTGHYCPANTNSSTRFPCPAGTFNPATDKFDASQCTDTPAGSYSPIGSAAFTQCPAGTWAGATRSTSAGLYGGAGTSVFPACVSCPGGYYCTLGSTITSPCAAGTYSPAGSGACLACPKGFYCLATVSDLTMVQCAAGHYCDGGVASMPSVNEELCDAGHYCPLGTIAPINCRPGTYSASTSLTQASDCTQCFLGSYCLAGVTTLSGPCGTGHYCPAGSSGSAQVPCLVSAVCLSAASSLCLLSAAVSC